MTFTEITDQIFDMSYQFSPVMTPIGLCLVQNDPQLVGKADISLFFPLTYNGKCHWPDLTSGRNFSLNKEKSEIENL